MNHPLLRTLVLLSSLAAGTCVAQDAARENPREQPVDQLLSAATASAERREFDPAIKLLTEAIGQEPKLAEAYYLRGRANFCAGKITESLADFDMYVALKPDAESRQWERGITQYYAGEFAKGAKQFELYQTYHDQDVENSVWRYLCVARADGVEKAQANMLPITSDRRVPMMQIYELYRGKLKPDDVLAAAKAGNPTKESLNTRLFYTHLYLGLWHEAAGRTSEAKEHLLKAEEHKIGHYMWDVAHVHAERLRKERDK